MLGSLYSKLKKDARLIVEKKYALYDGAEGDKVLNSKFTVCWMTQVLRIWPSQMDQMTVM